MPECHVEPPFILMRCLQVLDECLRAITGFKGMEDLSDDKLLDSPFTSDCVKIKTVSSAPLYGSGSQVVTIEEPQMPSAGSMQWCVSIDSHMPLVLLHTSHLVSKDIIFATSFRELLFLVLICIMQSYLVILLVEVEVQLANIFSFFSSVEVKRLANKFLQLKSVCVSII